NVATSKRCGVSARVEPQGRSQRRPEVRFVPACIAALRGPAWSAACGVAQAVASYAPFDASSGPPHRSRRIACTSLLACCCNRACAVLSLPYPPERGGRGVPRHPIFFGLEPLDARIGAHLERP